MSLSVSIHGNTITKMPTTPPIKKKDQEKDDYKDTQHSDDVSQLLTTKFNTEYCDYLTDRGLEWIDFDAEIKGTSLIVHKMTIVKDNGMVEIHTDMHNVPLSGNKDSTKLFEKVGAILMTLVPFEVRNVLAATSNEFQNKVIGDYKLLSLLSLVYTTFMAVFNVGMLVSIVGLATLFIVDYVVGKVPKPLEVNEQDVQDNLYKSFAQRFHMFFYLVIMFIVFSIVQVVITSLVQIYDPGTLKVISKNLPWARKYISNGTLGLHTFALGYALFYYVKRIKGHLVPKKQKTTETNSA